MKENTNKGTGIEITGAQSPDNTVGIVISEEEYAKEPAAQGADVPEDPAIPATAAVSKSSVELPSADIIPSAQSEGAGKPGEPDASDQPDGASDQSDNASDQPDDAVNRSEDVSDQPDNILDQPDGAADDGSAASGEGSCGDSSVAELQDAGAVYEDTLPFKKKEKKRLSPHTKGFIKGLALGIALILAIEAVIFIRPFDDSKFNLLSIAAKMMTIEDMIDSVYLYDADKDKMNDGIFAGMISGLTEDRYAAYYSPQNFTEETKRLNGSYVGIGITIYEDPEGRGIYVEAVNADGPAARAGILEGDIITEAGGINLIGASSSDAAGIITGEEGTEVVIKLIRDGEEFEFTVTRETIVTLSVHTAVLDEEDIGGVRVKGTEIGYMSITNFNLATLQLYEDALMDLVEDEEVSALIIDLRNNGGGDLEICMSMLDRILKDDIARPDEIADEDFVAKMAEHEYAGTTLMLAVEGKDPDDAIYFFAGDGAHIDIPIVVLVNNNSASASEIFAGTLRAYGYDVIGTTTFGKGIVQTLYNLDDGSAVKFTTDQYRLASGALIHGIGVEPTIEVKFEEYGNETEDTVNYADGTEQDLMGDVQVQAAVALLEQEIYDAYQGE